MRLTRTSFAFALLGSCLAAAYGCSDSPEEAASSTASDGGDRDVAVDKSERDADVADSPPQDAAVASDASDDAAGDASPVTPLGLSYTLDGIAFADPKAFGQHSTQAGFETKVYGMGSADAQKAGIYTRLIVNGGFPPALRDYPCMASTSAPNTSVLELIGQGWAGPNGSCTIHVTSSSKNHFAGTITGNVVKVGDASKKAKITGSFNYPIK